MIKYYRGGLMDTIGIICEYNPFHNGHLYHIKKCKELYPDATIILVVNGYFLERGEISLLNKEAKTKIALDNGVDLVLSLPFFYGSQSADNFALGAIKILNLFKASKIIFGSESNNVPYLRSICESQASFESELKEKLKKGMSYPKAINYLDENPISSPNDLLGLSYIKAIIKTKSIIEPISIKRTNNYHDTKSNEKIISAENIRNKLNKHLSIRSYVPKGASKNIEKLDINPLFPYLKYKVITEGVNINKYLTVDEGIENAIIKYIDEVNSIDELIKKVKCKRYTHNRLQRMIVHILIGLTKDDVKSYKKLDYVQILGFNNKGTSYLKHLENRKEIMQMTRNHHSIIYEYEIKCARIYDLLSKKNNLKFERSNHPIFKEN